MRFRKSLTLQKSFCPNDLLSFCSPTTGNKYLAKTLWPYTRVLYTGPELCSSCSLSFHHTVTATALAAGSYWSGFGGIQSPVLVTGG